MKTTAVKVGAVAVPTLASLLALAGAASLLMDVDALDVRIDRVAIAGAPSVAEGIPIVVDLSLDSPVPFPVRVRGGEFTVFVEGARVADATLDPLVVSPFGRTSATVRAVVPPEALASGPALAGALALNDWRADVRVTGEIDAGRPVGKVPVNVAAEDVDVSALRPHLEAVVASAPSKPAIGSDAYLDMIEQELLNPALPLMGTHVRVPPAGEDVLASLQGSLRPRWDPSALPATG